MFSSNNIFKLVYLKCTKNIQNANLLTSVTKIHGIPPYIFEHVLNQCFAQIVGTDFSEKFKEWAQHQFFFITLNHRF